MLKTFMMQISLLWLLRSNHCCLKMNELTVCFPCLHHILRTARSFGMHSSLFTPSCVHNFNVLLTNAYSMSFGMPRGSLFTQTRGNNITHIGVLTHFKLLQKGPIPDPPSIFNDRTLIVCVLAVVSDAPFQIVLCGSRAFFRREAQTWLVRISKILRNLAFFAECFVLRSLCPLFILSLPLGIPFANNFQLSTCYTCIVLCDIFHVLPSSMRILALEELLRIFVELKLRPFFTPLDVMLDLVRRPTCGTQLWAETVWHVLHGAKLVHRVNDGCGPTLLPQSAYTQYGFISGTETTCVIDHLDVLPLAPAEPSSYVRRDLLHRHAEDMLSSHLQVIAVPSNVRPSRSVGQPSLFGF
mmetsp:Transcript_112802/g.224388  ORF Transcript_112802/g.224388 Transcript_112802/m.224388 type:complete len:355 (-) Transcript_112802:382-1446(-)